MTSIVEEIYAKHGDVIARAQAQAIADVQIGIEGLRAGLAHAPEWDRQDKADGRSTHIVPKRAILAGHLRRIEAVHAGRSPS